MGTEDATASESGLPAAAKLHLISASDSKGQGSLVFQEGKDVSSKRTIKSGVF